MPESTSKPSAGPANEFRFGLAVDANSSMGYGHAVRCQRIARALHSEVGIYPLSDVCRRFFETNGFGPVIRDWQSDSLPPIAITDLCEPHDITDAIQSQGSLHVSIRDMGLAQCPSDLAIDGSVANVMPYSSIPGQALLLGPRYMITRRPVRRVAEADLEDTVLITLGGGASAELAILIAERLRPLGIRVVTTAGFGSHPRTPPTPDSAVERVMARCRFAISTAGTSLYDLLASGVPSIAVAVNPFQLQTADEFQRLGAAVSAGLIERLSSGELLERCEELLGNGHLVSRIISVGRKLVDGKGLSRIVDIVENPGRGIWKIHQTQTSTAC